MTDLSLPFLAAFLCTFLVAGLVKGVTGMGLPTVAMGMLGALISPVAAAGLLLVPSFVTNVWQLFSGPGLGTIARRLWPMMVAIVIGTVIATPLLATGGEWTGSAIGFVLIAYALYTLLARQPAVPPRAEVWLSPLIGLITGVVTGATGVFVVPAVPYLQALGFNRDELVQALGLSFTISTMALFIGLAAQGALAASNFALSVSAIAPALLGMWAGTFLRRRISPTAFRRGFLIFLIVLGAELAFRPFR